MDKRSFNLLFTFVAVGMAILGTYKIAKKKSHSVNQHATVSTKAVK